MGGGSAFWGGKTWNALALHQRLTSLKSGNKWGFETVFDPKHHRCQWRLQVTSLSPNDRGGWFRPQFHSAGYSEWVNHCRQRRFWQEEDSFLWASKQAMALCWEQVDNNYETLTVERLTFQALKVCVCVNVNVHVSVYMCECMYKYVCLCMSLCMCLCEYVWVCVYVSVGGICECVKVYVSVYECSMCMCLCMRVCLYECVGMYVYVWLCVQVCECLHVCLNINVWVSVCEG